METIDKTVKVCDFEQTPDYERNYERNCCADYVCECCGKKLNPKTMKQVQLLTSGEWTDETLEVPSNNPDGYEADGQGLFYVGPDCYKNIMRRIALSGETRDVRVITKY